MKRFILHLAMLLACSCLKAQNPTNYDSLWLEVYKLELKEQTRSASQIVDHIYKNAKADNRNLELSKSLFYKSKFIMVLEEDSEYRVYELFNKEIQEAEFPTRNFLQNSLATMLWQYYNDNRWRINTRSVSAPGETDFRKWHLQRLYEAVEALYKASLKNVDELITLPVDSMAYLLEGDLESQKYRPSIYDVFAHNTLEFFDFDSRYFDIPDAHIDLTDSIYFSSSDQFQQLDLENLDSAHGVMAGLVIFQSLLNNHADDPEPYAVVSADLERLSFVRKNLILTEKDRHYEEALLRLASANENHPAVAQVLFKLAHLYNDQGGDYQPGKNESYQFKKKEALEICDRITLQYPGSIDAKNAEILRQRILNRESHFTIEENVPIAAPFKALLRYRNLDSISLEILKVSREELLRLYKEDDTDKQSAYLKTLNSISKWNQALKSEGDYQIHNTEVIMPALDQGQYILVGRSGSGEGLLEHYNSFQVTNLSLINLGSDSLHIYQVVDRRNGHPIAGATVHFDGNSRNTYNLKKTVITDSNGLTKFETKQRHPDILVRVEYRHDEFYGENYYLNKTKKETVDDDVYARATIFTDRSIYRPGQTIHFKGIFLKHQSNKTEVVKNEQLIITLYDSEYDEVEEKYVRTNEFGSFSGTFKLPSDLLTGTFAIEPDEGDEDSKFFDEELDQFQDTSFEIQVEEYKRPTFEVNFDDIEKTYVPNDSIVVKGEAASLTGAHISGAKVKYAVVRNIRYSSWTYWSRSYYGSSGLEQIAEGELLTDNQGKFTIPFKAIPDLSISPADGPIFEYRVKVDITDINGETRSNSTTVNVAYQSLEFAADLPAIIPRNDSISFKLSTKNLNGVFVPTKGTISIYQIPAAKAVFRERSWPIPDYQIIPEDTFRKHFPYEIYSASDLDDKTPSSEILYQASFDTGSTMNISLSELNDFELGDYVLEIKAQDQSGQELVHKQKFTLSHRLLESVSQNKLFSWALDKDRYAPGETAKLFVASAAEEVTVNLIIVKKNRARILPVRLNKEVKEIEIPIDKNDLGGIRVFYHFALYNDYESGAMLITVPFTHDGLKVETSTFRDRLIPGGKETWAFTIKGPDASKIEAEVLASMYDASLDQFSSHNWSQPSFNDPYNRHLYNPTNAYQSFRHNTSRIIRGWYSWYEYEQRLLPSFDWFGFSFTGRQSANKDYLRLLAWKIKVPPVQSKLDSSIESGYVEGTILDELGDVLPGVPVRVQGHDEEILSDQNGNYKIKAAAGDVLVFRLSGYNTVLATIGPHNRIDINMPLENNQLSEVVVTALGIRREKRSLGYAVMEVADIEFDEAEVDPDVARLLRGKVAGVEITNVSGMSGSGTNIVIRGYSSITGSNQPLYVVDGVPFYAEGDDKPNIMDLGPGGIADVNILEGLAATALYGEEGRNGVVLVTTVAGLKKKDRELAKLKVRKDFRETAFFYPHLTTNKEGEVKFNFTAPEALTRWKLQLLAHNKKGQFGLITKTAVTQKDLMVMPNLPRFFRVGDTIVVSSKVVNLTNKPMVGSIAMYLENPENGASIETELLQDEKVRPVSIAPNGNAEVSWKLAIPEDLQLLQYKIVAQAGDFSDGEQKVVPVLSNRMLVTETLPLWTRGKKPKQFNLEKLKANKSSTLKHHRLTLEMTSNPAWYAIQSLPYLMEYPYECSEQTFSRLYANALATEVINSQPKIKNVFDQWRANGALESKLEANQELKSILLEESPWVREAKSESEQKKRLAMLFDLSKMEGEFEATAQKLKQMQHSSGGFPWFSGGQWASSTITQHIVKGFGHLKQLGVTWGEGSLDDMVENAIDFLQKEIKESHGEQVNYDKFYASPNPNRKRVISTFHLEYLYTRTFFGTKSYHQDSVAHAYFYEQGKASWRQLDLYEKALMAIVANRNGDSDLAKTIITALEENSVLSEELGMYWKANKRGWRWYQSPIEVHSLIIEAFSEIDGDEDKLNNLKTWLLKQKQVNSWGTTKATSEAAYALLLKGSDLLAIDEIVDVRIGGTDLGDLKEIGSEAGTGYFKTTWTAKEVNESLATISIDPKSNNISWGGLYWQYFEDLDKITRAETPLKLEKQLFVKKHLSNSSEPMPITDKAQLEIGDLIRVRIVLTVDREMEFIHMKDMRAAGLEPINIISEHKYRDGLSYYESTRDAATNFFFEKLPKGVHVFEYDLRVNNAGDFSNGITSIQSMYAPEFTSHSAGERIKVIK